MYLQFFAAMFCFAYLHIYTYFPFFQSATLVFYLMGDMAASR